MRKSFLAGESVETIYFGGGSPSLLYPHEIEAILNTIRLNFSVAPGTEITLEGNPDDLNLGFLKSIHGCGINRLSIGIQSFDSQTLQFLNRVHSSEQSVKCLEDVKTAGFSNYSVDLIYGIPSDNHKIWENDLAIITSVKPPHLSAYCLTIEEKTVFGRWLKKNRLSPIDEEFAAEQFETMLDMLENEGYEHYEISNFSFPGLYSRHNSSYWNRRKYLGIGPGAHSYDEVSRSYNIESNPLYIKALSKNSLPATREVLTRQNKINEYLLTSLRTKWGCSLDYLLETYDYDLKKTFSRLLVKYEHGKFIQITDNHIYLTKKGKLIADKIIEDLILDEND